MLNRFSVGIRQVEQRLLGKTGLAVSVLGFGTAEIGFENAEQATVNRLLGICADAGVNFIDTAECYGDSEETLGLAMSCRRHEFLVFTKLVMQPGWRVTTGHQTS